MNTVAFDEAIKRAEADGFMYFAQALRVELAKLLASNRRAQS